MLDLARQKAKKRVLTGRVRFGWADAAALPFENQSFDAVGIAFAFRNLTWRNPKTASYLSEIMRVLKPGGRLVVLETSQPENRVLKRSLHLYFRSFVAPVGGVLSGQPDAYRYLARSAADYYDSESLAGLLRRAGFGRVDVRLLFHGVAALHLAGKKETGA